MADFPANLRRTSAIAAETPSATAIVLDTAATIALRSSDRRILGFAKKRRYQSSVNPASGKAHVAVVEGEHGEDQDRRVEEHHEQQEEHGEPAPRARRGRDLGHRATARTRKNRPNNASSTATVARRNIASVEPVCQSRPFVNRSLMELPYM